jgi:hypothetical protein
LHGSATSQRKTEPKSHSAFSQASNAAFWAQFCFLFDSFLNQKGFFENGQQHPPRVARRFFENKKSQFESILEGLRLEIVDIFYGLLEYFTDIWYIL